RGACIQPRYSYIAGDLVLGIPHSLLDCPGPQLGFLVPRSEESSVKQWNTDGEARRRVIGLESAYPERDESEAAHSAYGWGLEHLLGVSEFESRIQIESQAL